jgi:hypothetical protein
MQECQILKVCNIRAIKEPIEEIVMGFSLKCFFEEVEAILAQDKDEVEILEELEAVFAHSKQYAEECGQLR